MAEPSWQEILRQRLVERNNRDAAYAPIIEQYRRLAQQTKLLKERNASLLKAVGSVRGNPNSSTVFVPGADDNPVRVAYVTSLEQQISTLRDELATVYKTQGQNAQRLLAMTETLREKEEQARSASENHRRANEELSVLRRKVSDHDEVLAGKNDTIEKLTDTAQITHLELEQVTERNAILTRDNAKLLQRWLDAKQAEANKMNDANEFYEDMRSKHQAVINWREKNSAPPSSASGTDYGDVRSPSASGAGNGVANGDRRAGQTRDGTKSQLDPTTDLSPNG